MTAPAVHPPTDDAAADAANPSPSLRDRVVRGGAFLALRQGLGMLISVGGMLLLTRWIGPLNYGVFVAACGLHAYLYNVCQWGIDVFLIRRETKPDARDLNQAFTLLLVLGVTGGAAGYAVLPLLAMWEGDTTGTARALGIMLAGLPLGLVMLVPIAMLDRALDFRRVAVIELVGQLIHQAVALSLAYAGWGAAAPVTGWCAQLLANAVGFFVASGYRPRLRWEWAHVRDMGMYGLGFSASIWVFQLRGLVNPLLVGGFWGHEAVGFIGLASKLCEQLSFVKNTTWRLSIAALGRLQHDPGRTVRAVTEGMGLQVLSVGPLMAAAGLFGPQLLPLVFGPQWAPVLEIFPFIAAGYVVNAMFCLHSSALYVVRQNWAVTLFHLVHVGLFCGAAAVLVPLTGWVGYGWAELVAVASYPMIHRAMSTHVGAPGYTSAAVWAFAFALAPFWPRLGWPALLPAVAVMAWPQTWQAVGGCLASLRGRGVARA